MLLAHRLLHQERRASGTSARCDRVQSHQPPPRPRPQRWLAFSDLHVSLRTRRVCLQVLERVQEEAAARGAGVLFLGVWEGGGRGGAGDVEHAGAALDLPPFLCAQPPLPALDLPGTAGDAGDFWHTRGALPVEPLNEVVQALAGWQQPTLMLPGNHDQARGAVRGGAGTFSGCAGPSAGGWLALAAEGPQPGVDLGLRFGFGSEPPRRPPTPLRPLPATRRCRWAARCTRSPPSPPPTPPSTPLTVGGMAHHVWACPRPCPAAAGLPALLWPGCQSTGCRLRATLHASTLRCPIVPAGPRRPFSTTLRSRPQPAGPTLFMGALWLPYRRKREELEAALAAALGGAGAGADGAGAMRAVFAHTDIVRPGRRWWGGRRAVGGGAAAAAHPAGQRGRATHCGPAAQPPSDCRHQTPPQVGATTNEACRL